MRRLLILVAVAPALLAGCGSSTPNQVSKAAAKAMRPYVANLRTAANGDSITEVTTAEQALVHEVDTLIQDGTLSNQRGVKIQDAASALLSDFTHRIEASSSPTPSDSTTSESPSESPSDTPSENPTTPSPHPTKTKTKHTPPPPTATVTTTSTRSSAPTSRATTKPPVARSPKSTPDSTPRASGHPTQSPK
jgi:hypothetical protein